MTRRDEILAISDYYDITMQLASERRDSMDENQLETVCEWWLDKLQEV